MPELRSSGHTRLAAAGVSDVGRTREINEDNILVKRDLDLYVVADGMGGHSAGDVASALATATLVSFFQALHDEGAQEPAAMSDSGLPAAAQTLVTAIKKANHEIHSRSSTQIQHKGMGSTIVAALVSRDLGQIHIAHVGDSRCYRIRDGAIEQLTRDHSLINEALALKPDLSKAQIARLPKNVITRALGMTAIVNVDVRSETLLPGDTFLLCSDGLSGLVPDDKIVDIVDIASDIQEACELLVDEANEAGGTDNISALMLRVEDDDASEHAPSAEVAGDEGTLTIEEARHDDVEAPSLDVGPALSASDSDGADEPEMTTVEVSLADEPTLAAGIDDVERLVAEVAEVEISAEAVEVGDLGDDDLAGLDLDGGEGEEDEFSEDGDFDASFADSFVSDHIVESFGIVNDDDAGPVSMVRVARCKQCSSELLIGNRFCVECGTRIET